MTPEEKAALDVKIANYRIYKPWTWAMRWGGWKGVPDSTIGAEVNPRVIELPAHNRKTTCMVVPCARFEDIGAADMFRDLRGAVGQSDDVDIADLEGSVPPASGKGSVDNMLLTTTLGCEYSEGSREAVGLNVSAVTNKHLNIAPGWHMVKYAIKIAEPGNSCGEWDYEAGLLAGSVYGVLDRSDVEKADKIFNGILKTFHGEPESEPESESESESRSLIESRVMSRAVSAAPGTGRHPRYPPHPRHPASVLPLHTPFPTSQPPTPNPHLQPPPPTPTHRRRPDPTTPLRGA